MTSRTKVITGIAVLVLAGLATAVYLCACYLVSREPHPIKNCTFMWAVESYLDRNRAATRKPVMDYPNVNGKSEASLRVLLTDACPTAHLDLVLRTYGYVPGLRTDDPGDLIMLYLKKPTKLESGKEIKSYCRVLFRHRKWAVLPHCIEDGHTDDPILLTTSEFRSRLKKTLDFVREKNRPNWEDAVKEHTEFLNSVTE